MGKKDAKVNFQNREQDVRIQENGQPTISLAEFRRKIATNWNIPNVNLDAIEIVHYGAPVTTDDKVKEIEDGDPVVVVYK